MTLKMSSFLYHRKTENIHSQQKIRRRRHLPHSKISEKVGRRKLSRYKYPKNILPKIYVPTDVSRGSDSDDLVTKNSQTIE